MTNPIVSPPAGFAGLAIGAAALFLLFLPLILSQARGRRVPLLAVILLTLTAAGLSAGGLALGAAGLAILVPMASGCWLLALALALLLWLDHRQTVRHEAMVWRLLHNDATDLQAPRGLTGRRHDAGLELF